jgi:NAD(P)-dependent dehydrogenase (short-subunit alcohol dehydrogenase family)
VKSLQQLYELKGKVAIITGGAGVLGTHFAHVLSSVGANVVIGDLDEKKCVQLASELKHDYKTDPLGMHLDLTQKSSVTAFVDAVAHKYQRIDILVNNAATKSKDFFAPFEQFPLEDWQQVMDVNLTGMFLMCQAVIPHMTEHIELGNSQSRGGSIINIASIYGIVGPTKEIYEGTPINSPAIYSTSKGGVVMLTKWLAVMYGDKGIRTNTLTPGGVAEHQLGGNEFQKKYITKVPMKRMTVKDDLTGPLIFLASEASSYVNGHNLVVDGGWTAW